MEMLNLPHGTDIQVGDQLITSGLGQIFPDGYPVAEVTALFPDESQPFMRVMAKPIAKLDRLKHVLLLWPQDKKLVEKEL